MAPLCMVSRLKLEQGTTATDSITVKTDFISKLHITVQNSNICVGPFPGFQFFVNFSVYCIEPKNKIGEAWEWGYHRYVMPHTMHCWVQIDDISYIWYKSLLKLILVVYCSWAISFHEARDESHALNLDTKGCLLKRYCATWNFIHHNCTYACSRLYGLNLASSPGHSQITAAR